MERWGEITEEDLHAYVDGALDPARRLDIALYLANSPLEAARVEAFRAQKEGIQTLFGEVVAEPLPVRLRRIVLRRLSLRKLRRCIPVIVAASLVGPLLLARNAASQDLALPQNASGVATLRPAIPPPSPPRPLPAAHDI